MDNMSLKKATILNAISKYGLMIVQLIINMILSRIVDAEEFGIVAIINVFLTFFSMIADMGIGISVIQHPEMTKEQQNRLFSFSAVLGIAIVIVISISSIPIAFIYDNEKYYYLCPLSSLAAFFYCVNAIPNAILTRDKRFDLIAIRSIIAAIVPGIISVFLAYSGFGVYALIFHSISNSIIVFIWNYCTNPLKLRLFKFKNVFSLMGRYSFFQLSFSIVNYFTRNLDNLIIGAHFGEGQLGNYNKAYTLNLYPNSIFSSVITGVLHPYIRDYKDSYEKIYGKMESMLKMLSLIGLPIMIICYWCSEEIITILFGDNWTNAAHYFKMLSICIWAQMLSSLAGSIFLGIERTDQTLKCGIINLSLIVLAILSGIFTNSLVVLSLAVGIAYNLIFFITYYILVSGCMKMSFIGFLKPLLKDYIFAALCIIVFTLVPEIHLSLFVVFCIKMLICLVCILVYLIISRQLFKIKNLLGNVFK